MLWEAIRFAKCHISITNKAIEAIFHARASLLYYNNELWFKKEESNFDVMDGAEVCELTGYFMLSLLSKHISNHITKNHIGLYRDDRLAILRNTSSLEAEKVSNII